MISGKARYCSEFGLLGVRSRYDFNFFIMGIGDVIGFMVVDEDIEI